MAARLLGMVTMLIVVRGPSDVWKAPASDFAAATLSAVALFTMACRRLPVRLPTVAGVIGALRMGWTLFLFKGNASLISRMNVLILGWYLPSRLVGIYAGAEKLSSVSMNLLDPITRGIYPRLSYVTAKRQPSERDAVFLAVLATIPFGLLLGGLMFLFAHPLVTILLGKQYLQAVSVLRILALAPPLSAISLALGVQWMLPHGMEREFNLVVFSVGILNILFAVLLVPRFGIVGMAVTMVLSQFLLAAGMWIVLTIRGMNPLSLSLARRLATARHGPSTPTSMP
jgi:PST family polysaccharide transporter